MVTLTRFGIAAMSAVLMFALAGIASATDYEVNTVSDTTSSGHCTLRDAINASQGNPSPGASCATRGGDNNTIKFSPSVAGQTIVLTSELPRLVNGTLTIEGPTPNGINVSASSIPADMLEAVSLTLPARFKGLTLSNIGFSGGPANALFALSVDPLHVTISNCSFTNFGGSVIAGTNTVIAITNSTFTGNGNLNSAVVDSRSLTIGPPGPPISQTTIDQGNFVNNKGVAVNENGSALTIKNSTFTGNKVAVQGGAIGATTITDSLFGNNQQVAFNHSRGAGQVSNCTFSGNGNAIFNFGTVTTNIVGSTFTANSGPAIVNDGSSGGDAEVTILNSTFSGNGLSASNGGAFSNTNGIVDAAFSTFANNGAHTFYTYNNQAQFTATILRGNIVSGGVSCYVPFPPSRYNDQGYNIYSDASCPMGPGSVSNTDPGLDPTGLGNHGGPTLTIALSASSAAAEFVPANQCLAQTSTPTPIRVTTDQRGYGRPAPIHPKSCSAGAFEYGAVAPPPGSSGGIFPLLLLGKKILF